MWSPAFLPSRQWCVTREPHPLQPKQLIASLLTPASLQDFLLTDCTKDVHTDADAQLLFAGQKLWAVNPSKGLAAAPATVRCSFEHAYRHCSKSMALL